VLNLAMVSTNGVWEAYSVFTSQIVPWQQRKRHKYQNTQGGGTTNRGREAKYFDQLVCYDYSVNMGVVVMQGPMKFGTRDMG